MERPAAGTATRAGAAGLEWVPMPPVGSPVRPFSFNLRFRSAGGSQTPRGPCKGRWSALLAPSFY